MGSLSQIPLSPPAPSTLQSNALLKVQNLSVTFKRQRGILRSGISYVRAVNDVSFEVQESEIVSLVGESGSGKTTIARCLLGLTPATSGSIVFNGMTITNPRVSHSETFRRQVQMVFQDPFESLNPREDVFTTISIPLRRLARMKEAAQIIEKIKSLLVEVGLDADLVMRKLPHQLSGGERQRVNIARALASDPKLLVADEPITMLDASQRLNILSVLKLLMITHDLASAKALSSKTAVMYQGKLVEIGPTSTILSSPAHPYTESILSATPRLATGILETPLYVQDSDPRSISGKGCVYLSRCPYATNICDEIDPELSPKSSADHSAACHNPLNSLTKKV
jgi:peptide/nickel transport system ATP-binding protein